MLQVAGDLPLSSCSLSPLLFLGELILIIQRLGVQSEDFSRCLRATSQANSDWDCLLELNSWHILSSDPGILGLPLRREVDVAQLT